jgi:hypothetical protein
MIEEILDVCAHVSAKTDLLSEGETMKRCGPFQLVLLAFLSTFVMAGGTFAGDSAYTFSINGRPVTPQHYSLNGDPSIFAPGDVIYLGDKEFDYGGLFMTLGKERDCRFTTASAQAGTTEGSGVASRRSPKDSRVFLELPDGRRKVVGLKVSWTVRQEPIDPNEQTQSKNQGAKKRPSSDRIPYNPLDSMSPEEIHGLWGIALIHWPEGLEQKLAHVNTDRVCLTVDDRAGVGGRTGSFFGGPSFPPIPPKTRYLIVEESVSPGLRDFSHFGQFRDLLFLKFQSFPSEPLDAGLIRQNTSMRYLDISGCGIPNCQRLVSLTDLRFVNISRCRDFENLEFAKDMRQLKILYMGMTKIPSLSPLDNSESIREIHAAMTEVRDLPKGDLPLLRAINLTSTKVDAQAVSQFRGAHPACKRRHLPPDNRVGEDAGGNHGYSRDRPFHKWNSYRRSSKQLLLRVLWQSDIRVLRGRSTTGHGGLPSWAELALGRRPVVDRRSANGVEPGVHHCVVVSARGGWPASDAGGRTKTAGRRGTDREAICRYYPP